MIDKDHRVERALACTSHTFSFFTCWALNAICQPKAAAERIVGVETQPTWAFKSVKRMEG